jgi:hypothetical protein
VELPPGELNAFTTPDLIAYVEAGLRANGADTKVTPPDAVLMANAKRLRRLHIEEWVDQLIAQAIDRDAIIETLLGKFADEPLEDLRRFVDTLYEAHRELRWLDALARRVGRDFEPADAAMSERGRELIAGQLTDGTA